MQCSIKWKLFGISMTFCFHTDVVKMYFWQHRKHFEHSDPDQTDPEIWNYVSYSVNNENTYMIYQIYLLNNMTGWQEEWMLQISGDPGFHLAGGWPPVPEVSSGWLSWSRSGRQVMPGLQSYSFNTLHFAWWPTLRVCYVTTIHVKLWISDRCQCWTMNLPLELNW